MAVGDHGQGHFSGRARQLTSQARGRAILCDAKSASSRLSRSAGRRRAANQDNRHDRQYPDADGEEFPHRPRTRTDRTRPVPQAFARRATRLGRAWRRRAVLFVLRPGGGVQGVAGAPAARGVRRVDDCGDRGDHLRQLFADHRAVSDGRRAAISWPAGCSRRRRAWYLGLGACSSTTC